MFSESIRGVYRLIIELFNRRVKVSVCLPSIPQSSFNVLVCVVCSSDVSSEMFFKMLIKNPMLSHCEESAGQMLKKYLLVFPMKTWQHAEIRQLPLGLY